MKKRSAISRTSEKMPQFVYIVNNGLRKRFCCVCWNCLVFGRRLCWRSMVSVERELVDWERKK